MKKKRRWQQQSLELAADHGYRARPGSKVFVIDRGAVRFDLPGEWNVTPKEGSCVLQTPEENCQIEITHFVTPPVDWSDLPLAQLLQGMDEAGGCRMADKPIVGVRHTDVEIAWSEYTYIDPSENREAVGYTAVARGKTVHVVISFAYWPECREQFHPVWEEILNTLQLGQYFADPRVGPRLQ